MSGFRFVTAVLCLAGLAGSCGSASKASLQMNLAPSTQYRLAIRTDGTFGAADAGSGAPVAFSRELVYVLRALQVYDNGDTAVAIDVEKARILSLGPLFEGSTFSARVSPRGRFVALNGMDAIRNRVRPMMREGKRSPFATPEVLMTQLSDEVLLASFNGVLNVWPSGPVAPGDTWEREPIYDPVTKTYEHTEFRLESMHATDARIDFDSQHRTGPEPDSEVMGTSKGEVHVSPSLGLLRSLRATSSVGRKADDAKGEPAAKIDSTVYVTFEAV